MRKKEQIIMLTSSLCVLTALTMTGVYVKGNNAKEQKKEYRLDLTNVDRAENKETKPQNNPVVTGETTGIEDAPNNDLDYEPDFEDVASGDVKNPRLIPSEIAETEDEQAKEDDESAMKEEEQKEENTEETESDSTDNAQTTSSVVATNLHFTEDQVLTLPVVGNILINFSMDAPVYHATLEQYRYSPALVISATEGTDVCAMCDAQITGIATTPQLGTQVTMSLGDGYECIYAQLSDVQVALGSFVKKGDVIGRIAAPTKYYSVEGPNLYLEMLKDEVPVDPMTFMSE